MHRGFTLIEIMVVLVIIAIVTVVALPTAMNALQHRQMSEGARILQSALAGARDAAIRDNAPAGIRLIPDPVLANAYSAILPLSAPPEYTEGLASSYSGYPATVTMGTMALVIEEAVIDSTGAPLAPTNWFWNIRVGDRIRFAGTGNSYTVQGPMVQANPERFVNVGLPGAQSPLQRGNNFPEFLLLMNGRDDNLDGLIDLAANGLDDDQLNGIDDAGEWNYSFLVFGGDPWRQNPADPSGPLISGIAYAVHPPPEVEQWLGRAPMFSTYEIRRLPIPSASARQISLPSHVVIDIARSKLQVDPLSDQVDIVVRQDGTLAPMLPYSTPAAVTLTSSFFQFWLSERSDIGVSTPKGQWWLISANGRSGKVLSFEQPDLVTGYSDAMQQ